VDEREKANFPLVMFPPPPPLPLGWGGGNQTNGWKYPAMLGDKMAMRPSGNGLCCMEEAYVVRCASKVILCR